MLASLHPPGRAVDGRLNSWDAPLLCDSGLGWGCGQRTTSPQGSSEDRQGEISFWKNTSSVYSLSCKQKVTGTVILPGIICNQHSFYSFPWVFPHWTSLLVMSNFIWLHYDINWRISWSSLCLWTALQGAYLYLCLVYSPPLWIVVFRDRSKFCCKRNGKLICSIDDKYHFLSPFFKITCPEWSSCLKY